MALLTVFAFAVFPLTIRYGRAFQPDASMLGAVVAGLACWDRYRSGSRWHWLLAGWFLLAIGFAIKITAGFLLIPLSSSSYGSGAAWKCSLPARLCCRRSCGIFGQIISLKPGRAREPPAITGRSGSACSGARQSSSRILCGVVVRPFSSGRLRRWGLPWPLSDSGFAARGLAGA